MAQIELSTLLKKKTVRVQEIHFLAVMRSICGVRATELIQTEAEQTGKPTYHNYSSIPIEQASGPRAAQSEAV